AVDVRQHDVQNDEIGPVFLDHHAGIEAGGGHAHLEAAVIFQNLGHELNQLDIVVDEQDLALAAFQGIGGNAVVLHELVQHFPRNTAEAGTGHAEALELPVVEATDNGLLADLANLGGFAGRENSLHEYIHPFFPGSGPVTRVWSAGPVFRKRRRTEIIRDLP